MSERDANTDTNAVANDNAIELRCGRWQDVLSDVQCDVLIADPPYSERTHSGHNDGAALERSAIVRTRLNDGALRRDVAYAWWTAADVTEFVQAWAPRVRGWFVTMTCHVLISAWEAALAAHGLYVFSPLACMVTGSRVRLAGDGPAQWSVWLIVARPKTRAFQGWGALPGGYVGTSTDRADTHIGGKPLWLMRAIVRDYSRPGDLICDPCAGGATTLLAAAIEGRRAIGAEMDPATYAKAQARIARGYTPVMRFAERPAPEQQSLLSAAAGDGE